MKPSSIETNELTEDETEYFKFEDEFQGPVELFTLPEGDNIIRAIESFFPDPPLSETEHIQEKENGKFVINSNGELLLGKMSFQMITQDEFDITGFKLVEDAEHRPNTGIDINIDGNPENTLKETDRFIFTDRTSSKDAYLNNLVISNTKENEEEPENPIYKEYDLTPEFNKEINQYETTILEYINDIDIKATLSDTKANMKIKIPKRDENGELIYEADGTTITYEEKELINDTKLNIKLNELGTQDTIITIIVTAEDGKTTNEYEVTIHRPYGTIKGNVYTEPTKGTTGKYEAVIRIYDSNQVQEIINWNEAIQGNDDIHDKLIDLTSHNKETQENGTYEIYIIPGTVDIMIDKPGYLDEIFVQKEIREGEEIDLGKTELYAGDVNKDGQIQLIDASLLQMQYGTTEVDNSYDISYDFNEDGQIQLIDISYIINNYGRIRNINM